MDGLRKTENGLFCRSSSSNSVSYSRRTIDKLFALSILLGFVQISQSDSG